MSQNSLLPRLTEDGSRLNTLDSLRGICVLGMIAYHTLFDVVYAFSLYVPPAAVFAVNLIRDLGAALFIFMSGFCFSLGHHHKRNIIVLNAAGLVITLATYIFARDMAVIFGILSFMGIACLLMCALKKPFEKLPAAPFAVVSAMLFLLFVSVNYGYIGYGSFIAARFPAFLYKNIVTAFFGFPYTGFSSGDYFSLLPWIFAYFCGFFTYRAIKDGKSFGRIMKIRIPFVAKVGRLSLIIYIVHQPVVYGVVMLAKMIAG